MSSLGFRSVVFHGELRLGELDVIPVTAEPAAAAAARFQFPSNEIRIHHISPQSERCSSLSILQTISSFSVRCKLESSLPVEQPSLINLHASCFHELKTAVVVVGNEEIHLVAMPSKQKKFPCFWCYSVPLGLYNASLGMLNPRCLSIVFDLDETLIVANTMKSFEDRIEALRSWITRESDTSRIYAMSNEMKRYIDDRWLLRQYIDTNCVVDNGKVYKIQMEEVPPLSGNHERILRPIVRIPDRNIVLTRINPEIRDTSVLVRLRPAWEDLRSYLTAKGRKRFEVHVCTMAERNYALEMWRLLDPEEQLISSKQLLDRVVCVKSGSRKSLLNVFQHGTCHPKMAMVIDDRSNVWEDKDQPRVHVVPAFTPYYAPQAEAANALPVLCVARNIACNVRGCFFKEFDEVFLRRISEVFYEDEVVILPPSPDVSSYLMSEDSGSLPNGNAPLSEGMHGAEVERRLNQPDDNGAMDLLAHSNHAELRPDNSQIPVAAVPYVHAATPLGPVIPTQRRSLLGPLVRGDSFPDRENTMKRGLLDTNPCLDINSQSSGEPPQLARVPAQTSASTVHAQGGWLVDDEKRRGNISFQPPGTGQESVLKHQNPFSLNQPSVPQISEARSEEVKLGHNFQKQAFHFPSPLSEAGVSQNLAPLVNKESGKVNVLSSPVSIGLLQEIGRKCSSKVEFKAVISTGNNLQCSFEVLFSGEKIAFGTGRTRKDAQQQAAENALHSLAATLESMDKKVASKARDALAQMVLGLQEVVHTHVEGDLAHRTEEGTILPPPRADRDGEQDDEDAVLERINISPGRVLSLGDVMDTSGAVSSRCRAAGEHAAHVHREHRSKKKHEHRSKSAADRGKGHAEGEPSEEHTTGHWEEGPGTRPAFKRSRAGVGEEYVNPWFDSTPYDPEAGKLGTTVPFNLPLYSGNALDQGFVPFARQSLSMGRVAESELANRAILITHAANVMFNFSCKERGYLQDAQKYRILREEYESTQASMDAAIARAADLEKQQLEAQQKFEASYVEAEEYRRRIAEFERTTAENAANAERLQQELNFQSEAFANAQVDAVTEFRSSQTYRREVRAAKRDAHQRGAMRNINILKHFQMLDINAYADRMADSSVVEGIPNDPYEEELEDTPSEEDEDDEMTPPQD